MAKTAKMSNPPDPNPQRPKLTCEAGAWDCHMHLFGPKPHYGLIPEATYDTADALSETYIALQEVLGLEHAVIVQATAQGHDHRRLLDALRQYPERFRAIAVPAPDISDAEIEEMHQLGVRGIRVVSGTRGLAGADDARVQFDERLIARVAELGWHVQVLGFGADILHLKERLLALPTPFVIDHAGIVRADRGINHPQFRAVLELLDSGCCWVKLSGPMRFSRQPALPYDDTLPFYRALVDRASDRLVWGSDWPHITYNTGVMPNDGALLDLLLDWAPDAAIRKQILVDNPRQLYSK